MRSHHFFPLWLLAAILTPSAAFAQHFSVGVLAGAGLTDGFQDQTFNGVAMLTHFSSDSKDFIVGPSAEIGFPLNVSVEVDALYRPLHLATYISSSGVYNLSTTVGTWEFPLLLKYRFPTLIPWAKPMLEVGPSFRAGSGADAWPSNHGITLGAGLEAKILKLKLAPQLRFTRWGSDSPPRIFADPRTVLPHTVLNQAEFLVGLSF